MLAMAETIEQEIQGHLIDAIRWIERARAPAGEARLSLRKMSAEAGLAATAAEQIVARRQKTVNVSTVVKLASRWNVRLWWMLTGRGDKEPFEEHLREAIVVDIVAELERRGVIPNLPALPELATSDTSDTKTSTRTGPRVKGARVTDNQAKRGTHKAAKGAGRLK